MNESRLKIIDGLLQKGWQSYYDFAKSIFGKDGRVFSYDADFKSNRSTIVQDFRLIQDIWYCARYGEAIPKVKSKSDKDPIRADIISKVFECKATKQFDSPKAPELIKGKDEYFSNPIVTFYRYKDNNYSIFSSGDYEKYIAFKTKNRTKNSFNASLDKAVTDIEVNNALQDSDVVLEPEVSAQIKRSIRLQEELREFEIGSRRIVDSLLAKIATGSEQKKKRWVQDTIKYYGNILELVKNPLSSYKPEEIASQIHQFAFFLASENQYHLLGERFNEALMIFQKLQRERKHFIDDIMHGVITGEESNVDISAMKDQMTKDDESVASILLSSARVKLDSGDIESAKELINNADTLSRENTLTKAQILHLKAIIENLCGNAKLSLSWIDEALRIIRLLKLEHTRDGIEIIASKAELLQRLGNTSEAKSIYCSLLEQINKDNSSLDVISSVSLNLAMLNLNEGHIEEADSHIESALSAIKELYSTEPDKHLPNLVTAKYIKGIVLMQREDIGSSISILEEAKSLIPENRPDLYSLCGAELLEILVTLHNLYKVMNNREEEQKTVSKIKELIYSPQIIMTEDQRFAIVQSLNELQ